MTKADPPDVETPWTHQIYPAPPIKSVLQYINPPADKNDKVEDPFSPNEDFVTIVLFLKIHSMMIY